MGTPRHRFGFCSALSALLAPVSLASVFALLAPPVLAWGDPGLTTTYLHDDARDGFSAGESVITPTTAPSLSLQWSADPAFPGGTTQPIDADGVLYVSDWGGTFRAISEATQSTLWTYGLGTPASSCANGEVGPDSTPTIATVNGVSTVFVGGATGQLLALNAANGALLWQTQLASSSAGFVWSSPLFYNGSIFIGLGSEGDCPLVPGELFRLDAATGATDATLVTVPGGCTGATIWSSATIDDATGAVFVDTGNGDGTCPEPEPYQEAMLRLDPSTLAVEDAWQTEPNSVAGDTDFGATPTLFTATIGGQPVPMVGAMNKNGYYYAFRRANLAAGPVWSQYFATPGNPCVACNETFVAPSAWDGSRLYVAGDAGQINGNACAGSLSALDPDTGAPVWQDCLDDRVLAAVTAAPGIVEVNAGDQAMVMNSGNGQQLFTYTETASGNFFWGAAEISSGVMYLYNLDGNLLAFVPGPPVGTPEAPMALLLPVCGVAAAGGVVTVRRARSKKAAAS
jgi:polyvinyl alcohol dehydrogenase (cytochrome)